MSRPIARLLTIVALLVGPALALWLASIDDPRAGGGQAERSWVAGYLDDDHRFGQFAALRLEGLTGIRLWLPRPVSPGPGALILRLRTPGDSADLATAQLLVAALPAHGPATFRFAAIHGAVPPGDRPVPVILALEARGVDRASAVSVMAGPNNYGGGLLLRDGREIPRVDLAFEPLYAASWFDRLLPITRLARSRPGIFGWPPLYALLAYALLLILGWFLGRLVRATRDERLAGRAIPRSSPNS